MSKYIITKNSTHTYDSHDGVISLVSKDHNLEQLKIWSKLDYKLQYRVDGNSGSIQSSIIQEKWKVQEQKIIDALVEYDKVFIASVSYGDSITESVIFENLGYYVVKDNKLFNLDTQEYPTVEATWYIIATVFHLSNSPFYYMVLNNKLCFFTEFTNEDLVDHPGVPYQYIEIDSSKRTFKEEVFGELIKFEGVKKVLDNTLILDKGTTEISIDLANKSELLRIPTMVFPTEVDSNLSYTKSGSKLIFSITQDISYISIYIPNNIFKYSSKDEELIFNYTVLRV